MLLLALCVVHGSLKKMVPNATSCNVMSMLEVYAQKRTMWYKTIYEYLSGKSNEVDIPAKTLPVKWHSPMWIRLVKKRIGVGIFVSLCP